MLPRDGVLRIVEYSVTVLRLRECPEAEHAFLQNLLHDCCTTSCPSAPLDLNQPHRNRPHATGHDSPGAAADGVGKMVMDAFDTRPSASEAPPSGRRAPAVRTVR